MGEEYTWHSNPVWLLVPYLQNLSDDFGIEVDWDAMNAAADYCDEQYIGG